MTLYCENLVRQHDRDRYRLVLSQTPRHRAGLFALFAFNHEIAKTREVVSDPTLGLIRLQWWQEAVEKMFAGEVMGHEVVQALAPYFSPSHPRSGGEGRGEGVVHASGVAPLSLALSPREGRGERGLEAEFLALIDARERDLENTALHSLDALEDYAEKTSSPLNLIALRLLGQSERHARAVSIAYALTGLLRAQPLLKERAFFPHGVAASDTARRAKAHLDTAKDATGFLAANAALARLYLNRMDRTGYELQSPSINLPPVGFALAAFAGRFR